MNPPPSSSTSTRFPTLEYLNPSTPHTFITPTKRINEGEDVTQFLTTKAYRDIGVFVMQLNRAMCPRKTGSVDGKEGVQSFLLGSKLETDPKSAAVRELQLLLQKAESIIDEAPPDPGPRRFGNVSYRKWYALLEEKAPSLLTEHLPKDIISFGTTTMDTGGGKPVDEIMSYFLGAFGSSQRLDYGTGHELSFIAFLGCLWKLGAFRDGAENGEVERELVLGVIEPYLRVVRKLILTYTLEPAGSHGVWGLDDHFFMPYIFGSAQLTRPINENEAMPLEGSIAGAPRPAHVVKADVVEWERNRNMYFSAIGFINDVKKGPFWEHSPILFDISGVRDGWGKINKGMIKMFNAEVLSKFPVVQHFHFGSLFSWEQDPHAAVPQQSVHMTNQPIASASTAGTIPPPVPGAAITAAPWAHGTRAPPPPGPGIPYSNMRAPWASGQPTARPLPPGGPASSSGGTTRAQITVTKAPWANPDAGSGARDT